MKKIMKKEPVFFRGKSRDSFIKKSILFMLAVILFFAGCAENSFIESSGLEADNQIEESIPDPSTDNILLDQTEELKGSMDASHYIDTPQLIADAKKSAQGTEAANGQSSSTRSSWKFLYIISVATGSRTGAGTDSSIYIKLWTKSGIYITHRLDNANRNDFEKGQTDQFFIYSDHEFDRRQVYLINNITQTNHSWFCEYVVVHSVPLQGGIEKFQEFQVSRWFSSSPEGWSAFDSQTTYQSEIYNHLDQFQNVSNLVKLESEGWMGVNIALHRKYAKITGFARVYINGIQYGYVGYTDPWGEFTLKTNLNQPSFHIAGEYTVEPQNYYRELCIFDINIQDYECGPTHMGCTSTQAGSFSSNPEYTLPEPGTYFHPNKRYVFDQSVYQQLPFWDLSS